MVFTRDKFEDDKAGSLEDGADNIVIHGTGQRVQTAQRDVKIFDAEYVRKFIEKFLFLLMLLVLILRLPILCAQSASPEPQHQTK